MATFEIGHPDVMEFIRAKRKMGACGIQCSLLIADQFMKAVEKTRSGSCRFRSTNTKQKTWIWETQAECSGGNGRKRRAMSRAMMDWSLAGSTKQFPHADCGT